MARPAAGHPAWLRLLIHKRSTRTQGGWEDVLRRLMCDSRPPTDPRRLNALIAT
jgi:hypothetical protein